MKNVLFFLGLTLFSIQAFSQNYELTGTVTENGVPVEEASVYVKSLGKGTVTNARGEYRIMLQEGTYTIVFSFGNQKSQRITIDSDKILNMDLAGAKESLEEVFLSSVRVNAQSPITYSNLTNEEIEDRNLGQDIPVLMSICLFFGLVYVLVNLALDILYAFIDPRIRLN